MEKGFLVMSAQNAKKKRLGSRRVAASQSDTSKSDRYNVTESYSLTQHHELEETAESLNDLSNPGDSKPETQHPPSPETALNKRKLGSSRRSKGRQFVNDSETKLYLNPGKEVEEKGRSNKTLETISLPQAVQLERQEDFGQGSDYVFALPKSDSSNTSDDYSEAKKPTIMDSPEGLMEIFIPKTDDLKTDNACENETKLKEINKSDTKSEEIKDIAHVVTQLSNSRDMPDEEPSNVLSVAERGSTKRDETDLFRQDRRLQGNSLANESHVVLESITLDITTDKNSHEQNTEVVYAAEQETFSLSKKELSKNEEQKPFSSSEDGEAWQSDNSTSKVHEEDVKPKEIYYMHQNVTKNEGSHVHEFKKLTDNRETVDDATEISNTYQAQLMVQSADDSVSNDDKQNEHYTNKRDCLMQENEEGDVYKRNISLQTLLTEINFPFESQLEDNTVSVDKQPDTGFDPSGIRRKLGSSRKNKGKRHVKEGSENITGDETLEPSATETARPEVLGQRTEHHVSLSVPHDSSMISDSTPAYSPKAPNFAATTFTEINLDILIPESENLEDQNQSNFKGVSPKPVESGLEEVDKSNNPLGEKVRGNHHLEDMMKAQETKPTKIQEMQVKDYSSETIMDNATEISSAMSRDLGQKSEGELSQENDLNIVVPLLHENLECSISTPTPSEVQNLRTTNYTEIAVDSLIPKRENVPLNQDEIDFRLVSENPIDTGLEGVDKSKISLSEELRKAHHSKDLNKVQEATVNPVQIHEIQPNDYSSVTDEAMQVTSTVPENLGQSEIRDTLQAQLMVQSPDDSAAKLELSTADDKQGEHHFLTQVIEEGGTSEGKDIGVSLQTPLTEINTSFESQLEENTVSIDEQPDTAFGSSGIRRKLGSSRRNKGRQHVKEFKVENATRDENPDTIQTPETETTRPEEFFQEREHDVPQSVPHDSSTFTVSTPAYSTEVQNQATTSYSEINLDSLIPESENLQERQDERDFKVVFDESVEAGLEGVDNSDTAVSEEVKNAHHSEDAEKKGQEEEVKVTQTQEIQPNDYSSVTDEAMQVTSTVPENLGQSEIRDTLQAQLMVQSPDDSAAKLELSTADDKQGAHHFLTQVIEEGGTSEGKDIGVSLQTPLTEINTSFESQLEENTVSIDEQPDTAFGSSGIRRKMGSSRRNKGRQHVKEFKVENATRDENPDTIQTPETETTRPEELFQESEHDVPQSVPHDSSTFTVSTPAYSTEVQNQATTSYSEINLDSLIPESENLQERQDERDFKVVFDESVEAGLEGVDNSDTAVSEEVKNAHHSEDAEKKGQEEEVKVTQTQEIQPNDYSSVTDEAMQVTSTVPENLGQSEIRDTLQAQLMVQSPDDSAAKLELSTADDKQGAHHFLTQVIEEGGTSEGKDIGVSLQTPLTEINTSFESQLEENTVSIDEQPDTAFGSSGIRRKLGSSRRNKGRQHVKEFKVENATRDENPDTIQTPETETTRPEELFQESEHDVPQSVPHDSSTFTVSTPAYSTEVQNQATTSYSEINLDSLIPESENLQERQDERDFKGVVDESVEAGLEGVDNSDTAVSEEVKNAHHSEDAEKKGQEEEVKVTQTQEIQPNDYSSVTDEAMQVTSTVPKNLGQSEIRDTLQAQLMVQSPDDSAAKLELSTADDKQGAHHFLTQVIEEGGTSEGKDIGVSLQTPLTEINTSFESQLEENTVSIDEQPDTAFGSSGIRRKLGSSRRNKGRQHVKEFKVENATRDENPDTIQTPETETTRPEELFQESEHDVPQSVPHDSSTFTVSTPAYSTEVQNQATTSYSEINLDSLIPESENLQERQDERDFKVVFDESVEAGLEGVDNSDTAVSEEVKNAHHSEDAEKKGQEEEVKVTQTQEIQPNDYSSVTDEAMQVTSTVPENLGQSEIRDTLQAQLMVQSPDDSAAKLELSTADDKQGAHHFLTQVIEEGGTSEGKDIGVSLQTPLTEINTSFESQLEENTVSIDEQPDTAFGSSGIRRKLGSSRRNKGRQHVKEFKVENATRDENPDTIQTPETETTRPEELFQESEHDVPQSVPHDSSTFTVSTPAYSTEVQNQATTSYSEINLDSLIPESENLQERQDERDFKGVVDESVEAGLEGVDNSDTAVSEEVKNAHHSEDAEKKGQEEEVKVTQTQEIQPNDYSSVTDEAMQVTSTVPKNLGQSEIRDTLQAQLMVQSPDDSAAKLELSTADDKQGAHHFLTQVIEEGGTSEGKDIGVSLQTPLTEINTSFESQLEENTVSIDEQPDTAFGSSGIRRKLGSSRRNKGRQHVKEFKVENATRDENPDTIQTPETETTRPEELFQESEHDVPQSVPHDSSTFTVSTPAYSTEVQNQATTSYSEINLDSLIPESENLQERQDERDFKVVFDESVEAGLEGVDNSDTAVSEEVKNAHHSEDAEKKGQEEEVKVTQTQEIQPNDYSSVTDEAMQVTSTVPENLGQSEIRDTLQAQLMVQSPDDSAAKLELSTADDKQGAHHFLTQVIEEGGTSEGKDIGVSLQTPLTEINTSFESQLEENTVSIDEQPDTAFGSSGIRRKLGSSRRNKGRQHVKEFKVENATRDENPDTIQTPETETTRPEELFQESEHDVPQSVPHDSSTFTVSTPAYSTEVQNQATTSYSEINLDSLIPESENLQERQDERDFKGVVDESVEAGLEGVDNSDTAVSEEVKNAHHSEDAEKKGQEEEVKVTQTQEIQPNDYSSVTDEAMQVTSTVPKNLGQSEIRDTLQAQLMVQSPDDSAAKLELSTADDKQGAHHFLTQVIEEGGTSEGKDIGVSLQTPLTEINTSFESQLEENTVSIDEQPDTAFGSSGIRRKLGSSRRNKGRQHVKEFKVENATRDENPDTIQTPETETTRPEEFFQEREHDVPQSVPHDSSTFTVSTPAYSTEVQNQATTSYSEINLDSLIPESENLQERQDERDFKVVFDESVEAGLEGVDNSDTAVSEEVKNAHHSEDAEKKGQEEEVKVTQTQEIQPNDYSSVTDEAMQVTSTVPENLGQSEIRDTLQVQLMVQSPDDSAAKLELSTADDKQGAHHFLTQVIEEGGTSEGKDIGVSLQTPLTEINTSFESQLEENTVSIDEQPDTAFGSSGIRRKLGSSRRNKGRQHVKEFKVENATRDENPDTIQNPETETTRPEELFQESEHDVPQSVPHDSSTFTVSTPAYSTEVQNQATTSYSEINLDSLIPESENLQERQDERDFKVVFDESVEAGLEGVDNSDTAVSEEVKNAHHSEDAEKKGQEEEVKVTQTQEIQPNDYSSVTDEAMQVTSTVPENLGQSEIRDTLQAQLMVQSPDDSAAKLELSTADDKQGAHHFLTQVIEEGGTSEGKDFGVSLQTPLTEINTSFESQLEENTVSIDEQPDTAFGSSGIRRKLGSSRRNKGRQHVKEFKVENATRDENPDTIQTPETETTRPEEFFQEREHDVPQSVPHDSSTFTVSTPAYSTEVQNQATTSYSEINLDSLIPESENLQERQDERDFKVVVDESVEAGLEGVDKSDTAVSEEVKNAHHSEDAEKKGQEEEVKVTQTQEIQPNDYSSVTDEAMQVTSTVPENLGQSEIRDTLQAQLMVQSPDDSAAKLELSTADDKQGEHHFLTQVIEEGGTSESKDIGVSLQTPLTEINTSFESQLEENTVSIDEQPDTAFGSSGIRRKLGSSRRNKGRQHVKEFKVENATHDENPEAIKTSARETRPEELLRENEYIKSDKVDSDHNLKDTVKKLPEEKAKPSQIQEMQSSNRKNLEFVDGRIEGNFLEEPRISDVDKEKTVLGPVSEDRVKDDLNPKTEQPHNQEELSEMEQNKSSFLISETNVFSEPRENSLSIDEKSNTGFQHSGHRRKLGSSRRNKGKHCTKDSTTESYHKPTEYNETAKTEEEEDVQNSTLVHTPDLTIVGVHTDPTVDQQGFDQSHLIQIPDKQLSNEYSITDTESKGKDECTKLSRQDGNLHNYLVSPIRMEIYTKKDSTEVHKKPEKRVGKEMKGSDRTENRERDDNIELLTEDRNLQGINLLSETHVKSENTEYMITTEIKTEKITHPEGSKVECTVVQQTFLPLKNEVPTNTEQDEHCTPADVTGAHQSEGDIDKVHEEQQVAQMQATHQTDNTSVTESKYSLQTLSSDTNISLDFQPQDSSQSIREVNTALSRAGNRKKLGSSRRNKGRQCVKDSVLEADQELKGEVAESSTRDETLNTDEISPATATTWEEEDSESLNLLTGCDTVKKDLMQSPQASVLKDDSDIEDISYHDGIVSSRSVEVLDKEKTFQVENTSALSFDKDLRQEVQDMASNELPSIAEEPAVDTSNGSGISVTMDTSNNQQEETHSENKGNLPMNSKQKRRKMGSTRRIQLNRKHEEETENKGETKESDFNVEGDVVEELPLTVEAQQNENAQPSLSAICKEQETDEATSLQSSAESNMIPGIEDLMAALPEQSASLSEEILSLFVKVDDVREAIVEPLQQDDFTNSETPITAVVGGRSKRSINQLLPPDSEVTADTGITEGNLVSFSEARESTLSDEETPESIKVIRDQDSHEKKPNKSNEEAHDKNPEMKNVSPNSNSANRRRKMGSTRRNLGSRAKEDLHQKQEVDNEAEVSKTNTGAIMTESVPGTKQNEFQPHPEHKDSGNEQGKEKVLETVEISHAVESQSKPLAEQTVEENTILQGQLVETEHGQTTNYPPSTSPKKDVVSESASGGRRRKLGSNRKSRGHQHAEHQTEEGRRTDHQNERDVRSITEEGTVKTTEVHREESLGLDKISEVEQSDKKPSSGISKTGEHTRAVRDKTSVQPCNAEIVLTPQSQTQLSLVGNPRGTDPTSKRYNVVMIGDSSVGKTSFMKRAQSGKFSLDIPASIGLDSLMWPVVVDGKPVVLQLWDTAGQERFHSITKQVFHKAQAFLLMYDITSTQSFSAVSYWANCIQESATENVIVLLLGNKSDCAQRRIKTHQGEVLAKEYDFEFMECSAATGENVIQSLEIVARKLSQRIDTREEATVLYKEPEQKKASRCC